MYDNAWSVSGMHACVHACMHVYKGHYMTCHKELRRITPNPQDKHAMEKGKS